jgi:hypothetical protein
MWKVGRRLRSGPPKEVTHWHYCPDCGNWVECPNRQCMKEHRSLCWNCSRKRPDRLK